MIKSNIKFQHTVKAVFFSKDEQTIFWQTLTCQSGDKWCNKVQLANCLGACHQTKAQCNKSSH